MNWQFVKVLVLVGAAGVLGQGQTFFPDRDLMTTGVYYYPEAWPSTQWSRDLSNIRKIGFEFVHMGEFAWTLMEPEEGRFDVETIDD